MINYAIQAMVTSGIEDIMLVTDGSHAGQSLRPLGNAQDNGGHSAQLRIPGKSGGIAQAPGLGAGPPTALPSWP